MFTYDNQDFTENLGNSNKAVLGSKSYVVKYGGRPWNMQGERDLFKLTTQGTAEVVGGVYLVTERLKVLPSSEVSRLEALPSLLKEFHLLTPPSTVSQQTPLDNLNERISYRLQSITPGKEIDSLLAELSKLGSISDVFEGQALIHGDINSSNVLLTSTGYRLIDFEWACANSVPEYDIASLEYINLYKHYPIDFRALYGRELNLDVLEYSIAIRAISTLSGYLWHKNKVGYKKVLDYLLGQHSSGYTGLC